MSRNKTVFLISTLFMLLSACQSWVSPTAEATSSAAPTATNTPTPTTNGREIDECITSFDQFAYTFPGRTNEKSRIIGPLFPWKLISTVPNDNGYSWKSQIVAARNNGDDIELWVIGEGHPLITSSLGRVREFYLYRPKSDSWEIVSSNVETSRKKVIVGDIFVTPDGSIGGRNIQPIYSYSNIPFPLLSKFDEETRSFRYYPGVLELPFIIEIEGSVNLINFGVEILLAKDGTFWFFIFDDGIYSFDPSDSTMVKHIDLPGIEVSQAVESPSGDFYFYRFQGPEYNLQYDSVFKFNPALGELTALSPPNDSWPVFSGIEVDSSGNLWLGSIGYIRPDGSWELMFPNVDYFFENAQSWLPKWFPPRIIEESSDGRLWFMNYHDTSLFYEGLAWYNPKTDTGCQFTNIASRIVEDANQNIWTVTKGNLYKYSLVP